ncbi:MAG TPA: hypothetical protein VGQ04_19800 [Chitinophagaceae bacterium]|jgi:hypothetical protein|nr:hypothetical protein [Chitinophagaceae bacterium]
MYCLKGTLFYCLLLFFISCKGKKDSSQANAALSINDSAKNGATNTGTEMEEILFNFDKYEEKGSLNLKNYFISIQAGYYSSDSLIYSNSLYPQRNLLIVRYKANNKSDTIKMKTSDYLDGVTIKDLSDSLHFKSLFLQMEWTGDSDAPWSEFAGYWNDTLRSFFTMAFVESLRRTDQWTLSGFKGNTDELVGDFQHDYPVTISLRDFSVSDEQEPAVQYIGYPTITLEPIKGYKMISQKDSISYIIKKGKKVFVDTLYRAAGRVRLITSDSIIFHTKFDEAKGKLQENTAG